MGTTPSILTDDLWALPADQAVAQVNDGVQVQASGGIPPLAVAVLRVSPSTELVKALLMAGHSPNDKLSSGQTVLEVARSKLGADHELVHLLDKAALNEKLEGNLGPKVKVSRKPGF
jgi:hypothetical protein